MAIEVKQSSIVAEYIDINLLQPHPKNTEIYGEEDVTELIELIKTSKWIKPLVITQNNRIISGHSRWKAAKTLGYKTVPFERRSFANELDELEALLLENASRQKNMEQKLREIRTFKHIEVERAKLIQEAQGTIGQEHGKEGGRPSKIVAIKQNNSKGAQEEKPLASLGTQGVSPNKVTNTSNAPKNRRAPTTDDKLAARFEVGSRQTLKRGDKALDAIDDLEKKIGNQDAANGLRKVLNGEKKNVTAAAQLADLSEKSVAILTKIGTGEAKDVQEAKTQYSRERLIEQAQSVVLPDTIQILNGDFAEVGKDIADKSVDFVFTDPPYHEEHLGLWTNLGLFADRVLKPGGVLLAYSGKSFLPQVLNALSEHLEYCWVLGQFHKGQHTRIWKYRIWTQWRPLVLFSKGKMREHDWLIDAFDEEKSFTDIIVGDKGNKEAHEWAQGENEAQYFIQKFTQPGDLVIDPMCGSGTIVRMAHKFKRHAIGIEKDPQRHDVALGIMKEVINHE